MTKHWETHFHITLTYNPNLNDNSPGRGQDEDSSDGLGREIDLGNQKKGKEISRCRLTFAARQVLYDQLLLIPQGRNAARACGCSGVM